MEWTGKVDASNVNHWITEAKEQRIAYYKDGSNTWGDDFYDVVHDALVEWLEENRPNDPFLDEVGADFGTEWEINDHEYPMGSLDKVKLVEEFEEWFKKHEGALVIQEKLDGISIALTYDSGKLVSALTRSNGTKGENITRNVQKMKGIPKQISYTGHVVLRGEILLYHSDFKEANKDRAKNDDQEYKNPRNAAAGMAKDQKGTYCSYLTVQVYDVMNMQEMEFDTEEDALKFIRSEGFIVVDSVIIGGVKSANRIYEEYVQKKRNSLDWDIDGLVIKTYEWVQSQGKDWKKPKNKIAWKFPPQRAQTTIRYIEASAASRITPVAVFDPVECGGVTIQRASLANWKLCLEKNIGPGARVEISRRNDVIPYVESVLEPGKTPTVPKVCPVCNSSTEWELNTSGEETAYLTCSSADCPTKLVKLIQKWLDVHEAKGVGSAFVEYIVESRMVTSLVDFLNFPYMTNHQSTLMSTDGFGARKLKKINEEIEKTCNSTVTKFFAGLNFRGIGKTRIEAVVEALDEVTVQKFIDFVSSPALDGLESFGEGLAPLLKQQVKSNSKLIDRLQSIVTISDTGKVKTLTNKFEGMSFCFTASKGEPSILKRKEAESKVLANGGKCSGVSKTLTYLVTNAPEDGSTNKIKKAKELGIKIISEEEFLEMLGEAPAEDIQVLFGLEDKKAEEGPKQETQVLFGIDDL